MLLVLSPAKNLDFDPPPAPLASVSPTAPRLANDIRQLSKVTARFKARDIKTLMGVSDALAELNAERFKAFQIEPPADVTKPAALAFNGDVYQGLEAKSFTRDDMAFAQDHVRILSGLYGLLRPMDAIQPYRLEMGTRVKTRRGATLYAFWGDRISKALNADFNGAAEPTLINLASTEYFSAVDKAALKAKIVTPVFKEVDEQGDSKIISFYAKKARGMMARYAVLHRITDPEALMGFDDGGYRYDHEASDEDTWVFSRPKPPTLAEQ